MMKQIMKEYNLNNTYFIGGGTCCGKSTISEMLVQDTGYMYYKLDDDLFNFLDILANLCNKTAIFQKNCSQDEMWLRAPELQCEEELGFYNDIFPLALEKIEMLSKATPIITEGAGYLPQLMYNLGVDSDRYVCIVPTRGFRLREYEKRPWIEEYLKKSTDKKQAFQNWMERDALFSEQVLKDAKRLGYKTYVVDGTKPPEDTVSFVKNTFGIKEKN